MLVFGTEREDLLLVIGHEAMCLGQERRLFAPILTFNLVPLARVELARPFGQRILSPQRLPIPPQGLTVQFEASSFALPTQLVR